MARIPTIKAQSIQGLPGTAGGVLLGKTGISNIQIQTPLTQKMNPAAFGQTGAALAEGASRIFNDVLIPRMKKEKADQEYQEYADASSSLNQDIDQWQLDIESNPGQEIDGKDIVQGTLAKQKTWLGSIDNSVSSPRYQAALKAQFAQRISTLALKAANLKSKHNNQVTESAFTKAINEEIIAKLQLPSKQDEVTVLPNWDKNFQTLQGHENGILKSGLDPVKKAEAIESGRLKIFNEVVARMKLQDPKLGIEFMKSAHIDKLLEGTSTGYQARVDAITEFQTVQTAHTTYENKINEAQDKHDESIAKDTVEALGPVLYEQLFVAKTATQRRAENIVELTPVYLETNIKPLYRDANMMDEYKVLYDQALKHPSTRLVGVTDPEEHNKFLQEIYSETINMNEMHASEFVAPGKKLEIDKMVLSRKRGQWLKEDYKYTTAKKTLSKLVMIPADSTDNHQKQMAAVALGKFMAIEEQALTQGQEWTQKNVDWFKVTENLMAQYGGVYKNYGDEHTQTYLYGLNLKLPKQVRGMAFRDNAGKTIYDFEAQEVELHNLATKGIIKGEELREAYEVLDQFRNIITPNVLHDQRQKIPVKDIPTSKFGTFLTKPPSPADIPERQEVPLRDPQPTSNIIDPARYQEIPEPPPPAQPDPVIDQVIQDVVKAVTEEPQQTEPVLIPEQISLEEQIQKNAAIDKVFEIYKVQNKQNTIDRFNILAGSGLVGKERTEVQKQLNEQYPTGPELMDILNQQYGIK